MCCDPRATTWSDPVETDLWTIDPPSLHREGDDARGVGAVLIRIDVERAARLVVGVIVRAHDSTPASPASAGEASRDVWAAYVRAVVGRPAKRGRP